MAHQDSETYPFTFKAFREKAPIASGVYRLCTAQRRVYVGESGNIRQSLFRHLNEPSASMNRFGPLSFFSEISPPAERKALRHALVTELEPACPLE